MARPLKRTVDYFPHFVNAGKTLLILQNEFGNDGYAFWFKLLSLLCKTDGQVYDYNNPASWRLLLAETCVSGDIANKVLQLLAEIEAIDPELYLRKIIWIQHLVDNLSDVFTRRRNGSVPEKPINVNINPVSVSRKPQTRPDHTRPNHTIYIVLFNLWNEQAIIKHKTLTDKMKRAIDRASKDFNLEEISQAIKNYAEILKGDQYYFKHSWTLHDFLQRGLEKFAIEPEIVRQNYLKDKGGQDGTYRGNPSQKPAGAFSDIETD